jgi:hypothetical protein
MAMSLGQVAEIALMLLLWPAIRYGGMRMTIFLGILAWPVRYGIFAIGGPAWLVVSAQALHGICYAFFFVGGMIAVERLSHKDLRASAQGLIVFVTNGVGMFVGHLLSGRVHDYFIAIPNHFGDGKHAHNWTAIFLVPVFITIVAGIAFLALFNEKKFREDSAAIQAEDEAQGAAEATARELHI